MADETATEDSKARIGLQPIPLAQTIVAGIGALAGLSYALGRVWTHAYYSHYGLSPAVLSLSTEDYLFASLDIITMCLGVLFWIFLRCQWTAYGAPTFLGLPAPKNSSLSERVSHYSVIGFGLFMAAIWFYQLYAGRPLSYPAGTAGLLTGLSGGFLLLLVYRILEWLMNSRMFSTPTGVVLSSAILLLTVVPLWTGRLAAVKAEGDLNNNPFVSLICTTPLDESLSTPGNPYRTDKAKILLIDRERVHVLNEAGGEGSPGWVVHSLPKTIVEDIICVHDAQ